jgi:predicted nucleotidyltransferase
MNKDYSEKLEKFTLKLRKIPEILAVYYTGSTAKKSWDEFSDIDIDIVIDDKDYDRIIKQLPDFLSIWGKIKLCNNYIGMDEVYAYIDKDYTKVEINPLKLSELKPKWELKNIRIAYDNEGTLTKVFEKSKNETRPQLDHNEIVHFFLHCRNSFFYAARHYARGQKLSGVSEIGNIGGQFFYYLGKIKGMEGYESIRTAEKHLTKKEWNYLKISRCRSLKKFEVKRAIKANWEYMKYLENRYEKLTKRKLNLKCNDKEILANINKTISKSSKDKEFNVSLKY